ncbi:MAG: 2-amino-4-hydroxy-6-hydroxymethyldihydropteridine diphosphokinase [Actinomycetota bacterium]
MKAYLGLGANLGDRLETLQRAADFLDAETSIDVVRSSRVYETRPVGGPDDQPDFLNAVIQVETGLNARALLDACLQVEDRLGRVRAERWGPRTIDIDLLTLGDERIDDEDLVVPHPRMHERMFVLAPLLELDADPPLPGGRRAETMRLTVSDPLGVRPFAPPLLTRARR